MKTSGITVGPVKLPPHLVHHGNESDLRWDFGLERFMKVFGPYTRKDGRQHVILQDPKTKKCVTKSYPRYLYEQHHDISLPSDQEIDHINDDFTDNRIENLQVLSKPDNIRKSRLAVELETHVCPVCHISFQREVRKIRRHQVVQKKAGPFCGKRCAGRYGALVKHGLWESGEIGSTHQT